MSDRGDADLLQILIGEVRQHRPIDVVRLEPLSVLRQAQSRQPPRDVCHLRIPRRTEVGLRGA